jgi:hypothetical protein
MKIKHREIGHMIQETLGSNNIRLSPTSPSSFLLLPAQERKKSEDLGIHRKGHEKAREASPKHRFCSLAGFLFDSFEIGCCRFSSGGFGVLQFSCSGQNA